MATFLPFSFSYNVYCKQHWKSLRLEVFITKNYAVDIVHMTLKTLNLQMYIQERMNRRGRLVRLIDLQVRFKFDGLKTQKVTSGVCKCCSTRAGRETTGVRAVR